MFALNKNCYKNLFIITELNYLKFIILSKSFEESKNLFQL